MSLALQERTVHQRLPADALDGLRLHICLTVLDDDPLTCGVPQVQPVLPGERACDCVPVDASFLDRDMRALGLVELKLDGRRRLGSGGLDAPGGVPGFPLTRLTVGAGEVAVKEGGVEVVRVLAWDQSHRPALSSVALRLSTLWRMPRCGESDDECVIVMADGRAFARRASMRGYEEFPDLGSYVAGHSL